MPAINIDLIGISAMQARLAQYEKMVSGQRLKNAMAEATEDLLAQAVTRAPVKEGKLRESGAAEVKADGKNVTGLVSFDTPYAAKQHEEESYNHPLGGEAKYLEKPMKESIEQYKKHIGEALP